MVKWQRRRGDGFTLIEVLVSVVILGAVISLASYSYSFFIDGYRRNLNNINQELTTIKNQFLVNSALKSTHPFVVKDNNRFGFFFFGNKRSLDAVTGVGLFNPSSAAIYRVRIEDNNLVYFERSTSDVLLTEANQNFEFNRRLVIASNVTDVSFRYLGWTDIDKKREDGGGSMTKRRWFDEYSGMESSLLPTTISIVYTQGGVAKEWHIPILESAEDIILGYQGDQDAG